MTTELERLASEAAFEAAKNAALAIGLTDLTVAKKVSSTVHDFLDEASTNTVLQKIRQETAPKADDDDDEVEQDVLDADAEDLDDAPVRRRPKKPLRRVSKTLMELLFEYDPDLKCGKSDAGCLLAYITKNVRSFDFEGDTDKLEDRLKLLQRIVSHMFSSTSTQRNYFVDLTSAFKAYFIRMYGEGTLDGKNVEVVRKILRADGSLVQQYLSEREMNLRKKLMDKYHVQYEEVEQKVHELYNEAFNNPTRASIVGLSLALICSMGARKTALLDPSIRFMTYGDYKRTQQRLGNDDVRFRIGVDGDDEDNISMNIDDADGYDDIVGFSHTIVQSGKLKSVAQQINKFVDEDSDLWVPNETIIKPTIILDNRQIVRGVQHFRKFWGITKATFTTRRRAGNAFGSHLIGPVLKTHFRYLWSFSKQRDFVVGSHIFRKIYANASFLIYQDQVQRLTNKYFDRSTWIASVLGHGLSLKTSLSYSNVVVDFKMKDEIFKAPPKHIFRLLEGRIKHLENALQTMQEQFIEHDARMDEHDAAKVRFVNADGEQVFLDRHPRRRYKDINDRDTVLKTLRDRLVENKITPSVNNMAKLGVGRGVINAWRKHDDSRSSDNVSDVIEKNDMVPRELINDRSLGKVELPVGTKVLVDQSGTENAARTRLKREIERFGEDHVTTECEDGQVKKKQKIATGQGKRTITRDLCVEDR